VVCRMLTKDSPPESGLLQAPLCLPPRPAPRRWATYQRNYWEKTKEKAERGRPRVLLLFCGGHEGGFGKEERLLLVPGTQLLSVRSMFFLVSANEHKRGVKVRVTDRVAVRLYDPERFRTRTATWRSPALRTYDV